MTGRQEEPEKKKVAKWDKHMGRRNLHVDFRSVWLYKSSKSFVACLGETGGVTESDSKQSEDGPEYTGGGMK